MLIFSAFTRSSDHVHTGIAFWVEIEGERHLMITEAQGGAQRRIINLSYYQHRRMDILCSQHEWSDIKDQALERLGQVQYNWIEAGYVGINELFEHLFDKSLPDIEFEGEICSEFVANVLKLERNYLSPAKLYRYMTKQLGYKKRVSFR